jgi:hypothetical protein
MAFYTSYLWRSVELNDGINYLIPLQDADFDSQNEASPSYAERQYDTPILLGATLQPGTVMLKISIKAGDRADFEDKLDDLKRIFSTSDPTPYKLERKLPHESVYRYLEATVSSFVVNRLHRTVDVTLSTEDRRWKAAAEETFSQLLFNTSFTEDYVINYEGFDDVEPVLELTPLNAPSTGNAPRYSRETTIYIDTAAQALNLPLLIVSGWNSSATVSAGKIRSDALDTVVTFTGTNTRVPRIVAGTEASRNIWVKPTSWPTWKRVLLMSAATNVQTTLNVYTTEGALLLPASGSICLDSEIITYTGITYTSTTRHQATLTGVTRGTSGTAAASHVQFTRVKQPVSFTVSYGYGAGFEQTFANDYSGWAAINFDQSTNSTWVFTQPADPAGATGTPFRVSWSGISRRVRTGEVSAGQFSTAADDRGFKKAQLYGGYQPATTTATPLLQRLVMLFGGMPRLPEQVRVKVKLKGTASAGGAVEPLLRIIRSGAFTTNEVFTQLWTTSHSTNVLTDYDSGFVSTNAYAEAQAGQVLTLEVKQPPINSSYETFLILDELHLNLDITCGGAPVLRTLGSEKGPATGDYPIWVRMENLTTGDEYFAFNAATRLGVTTTIDCDERSVSGGDITWVDYNKPIWLRLRPGNNTIRFGTFAGAGEITLLMRWRNRY